MLRKNDAPLLLTALAVSLLLIVTLYPGFMSTDSFMQLIEARRGVYSNHHPPVMAFLWRYLDMLWPGPAPMLALHVLVFQAALVIIARLQFDSYRSRVCFLLIATFLPVGVGFIGIIWKDMSMGVSLLLAFALAINFHRTRFPKTSLAIIFLLLTYALSVRHNAFPAILPFCLYLFWKQREVLKSLLRGLAGFATVVVFSSVINGYLTSIHFSFLQMILTYDLVAISIQVDKNLIPPVTFQGGIPATVPSYKKVFERRNHLSLYRERDGKALFKLVESDEGKKEIRRAWLNGLLKYPGEYLYHRWEMLRLHYGIGTPLPYQNGSSFTSINANNLGIQLAGHPLQKEYIRWISGMKTTEFYRPWIYLVLSFLSTFVLWLLKDQRYKTVMLLTGSSLFFGALNFFVIPAADIRYAWWTMLAGTVATLIMSQGVISFFKNRTLKEPGEAS